MNIADLIVIILLGTAIMKAYSSLRKGHCQDCSNCQRSCGGKRNGKEFKTIVRNQESRNEQSVYSK